MKAIVTIILGVIVGTSTARASGRTFVRSHSCGSASYGHASYSYQAPAVYAAPIYSVSYQPDLAPLLAAMIATVEEQKAIREDMKQMLQQGFGAQRQAAPHPGLVLMQKDCVRCHDASVAKAKGRGYVFFQGGQLHPDLKDEDVGAMLKAVKEGRMPKDIKWTGEQKAEVAFYWLFRGEEAQKAELPPQAAPGLAAADVERIIDQRLQIIIDRLPPQKLPPAPKKPAPPKPKEPPPKKDPKTF